MSRQPASNIVDNFTFDSDDEISETAKESMVGQPPSMALIQKPTFLTKKTRDDDDPDYVPEENSDTSFVYEVEIESVDSSLEDVIGPVDLIVNCVANGTAETFKNDEFPAVETDLNSFSEDIKLLVRYFSTMN